MSEFEVVGRQCFPSEEMKATPNYRKEPWVDGEIDQSPSRPEFYRVEPLIRLSAAQSELAALREELAALSVVNNQIADQLAADREEYWLSNNGLRQSLAAAERRNAELLELLRNPSDEMVEAGNGAAVVEMEHDSDLGSCGWISNVDEVFAEMLKIALKPTESGASE